MQGTTQGNPGNVGTWWWGQYPLCKKVTCAGNWIHAGNHVPTFPAYPCISLHGSLCGFPPLWCTYIPCIPCVGSIPCMGDLFVLGTLSPPPCTYIPYVSPVWFPTWVPITAMYLHSLHFPVCVPTTTMYLHSLHFSARAQFPVWVT